MSVKLINFDNFLPTYGPITIPHNTLLYRGYDNNYNPISDRPTYFTSDVKVAHSYKRNNTYKLGAFMTTKRLKLYDLRYIKKILLDLFDELATSKSSDIKNFCDTLSISYGLCSYKTQLELIKKTLWYTYK